MNDTEVPPPKRKTIAYVDGFNLYFGILKQNPSWKWLDLVSFLSSLRPDEEIVAVRYFTALIDDDKSRKSLARDRQKRYLVALRANPKVTIIHGKYQFREVTCKAACGEKYLIPKEKKTDVAMAVAMISDAFKGLMDSVVLVSGDSDLEPAVHWIRKNYPAVRIAVYVPESPITDGTHPRRNDAYLSMGVTVKPLPTDGILKCQFPPELEIGSGRVLRRPSEWN